MGYVLSLDVSTNSIKTALIDETATFIAKSEVVLDHIYLEHGWAEQNPNILYESTLKVIQDCLINHEIDLHKLQAISLTNQKGSIVAFDKNTKEVISNIIAPNDKRVDKIQHDLEKKGLTTLLRQKAGLFPSNNLAALKMLWILQNVKKAKDLAKTNCLAFATLESFLIYRFTNGKTFVTDATNALSTGLVNIETLDYDDELLDLFNINKDFLAKIESTDTHFANVTLSVLEKPIPIISSLCNQQSALIGSDSLNTKDVTCTFSSTGSIFLNLETTREKPTGYFNQTIANKLKNKPQSYCIEGAIMHTGSVVKWLRDSLGLIHTSREIETLAYSVPDSGGLFFVPTLSGVSAPYWDNSLQGTILGIQESTNIGHFARASLEGIAYQTADTIQEMLKEYTYKIESIKCGGKMAKNTFLMQMIANLLGIKIVTALTHETSLVGTALLAHLKLGNLKNMQQIASLFKPGPVFEPKINMQESKLMLKNWHLALNTTKSWSNKVA